MLEKMEGRKLKETEVVQLLKAKHLQTAQRGCGETGTDVSVYTEWNLQAATQIYTKLHSDPVICEVVAKREACSGSDSCFNSLVKLEKLAQKPSCSASRRWIFQWMDDMLSHGMLRDEDLTKKEIHGGSGSLGLVALGEFKWKAMSYVMDIMSVQAKIREADRVMIKSKMSDPWEQRSNTESNLGWQGTLTKSSLELVTFLQELLYNKVFDAVLRQAIKPSSHPEILQELESVQDAWKHVCSMRANELAEEKALVAKTEGSDEDDEEDASLNAGADTEQLLKMARKQPNTLAHGSEAYWRSVANSTVRMYCSFAAEGDKSAIMNVVGGAQLEMGEVGKSALLVHLDTSLLGESQGPGQQERLRRNWKPDDVLLQKLLGSTLMALGSQADKKGLVTTPPEGVLVMLLDPLNVANKATLKDSSNHTVWLCFQEAVGCEGWFCMTNFCNDILMVKLNLTNFNAPIAGKHPGPEEESAKHQLLPKDGTPALQRQGFGGSAARKSPSMLQRLLQRRLHWLRHSLAHHCVVEFAQDKIINLKI